MTKEEGQAWGYTLALFPVPWLAVVWRSPLVPGTEGHLEVSVETSCLTPRRGENGAVGAWGTSLGA